MLYSKCCFGDCLFVVWVRNMEFVIANNIAKYQMTFEGGLYSTLFFVAVVYIVVFEKEPQKRRFLLGFAGLFAFIYWCPITSYIITHYCVGSDVIWRMFWILPSTIYIAYMIVDALERARKKRKYLMILGILAAVVWLNGSTIYTTKNFPEADNPYKISSVTMQIADIIKADAKEKWIENRGVIVPDDMVNQIKQYDGELRMPYGRDMLRNQDKNEDARLIHYMVNHLFKFEDVCYMRELSLKGNYQYLVCTQGFDHDILTEAGYHYVDGVGDYDVFCIME